MRKLSLIFGMLVLASMVTATTPNFPHVVERRYHS